jgi:branched-chain amino acid transport system ATP-binding protein
MCGGAVSAAPLLRLRGVFKRFRGLAAVTDVSFDIQRGAIVALIGPNGAGKTTVFNMIAGMLRPDAGEIALEGVSLVGKRPDVICKSGIGRTFQIVRPFNAMTVEENVMVGALARTSDIATARRRALELLELLELGDRRFAAVQSITLPDRKRLEVARALATRPKLLLLDEVMAGLRPTEIDRLLGVFRRLNATTGVTILLIEHVMRAVMALSHYVIVLHHGEVIATGSPEEVKKHRAVLDSYLGEEAL